MTRAPWPELRVAAVGPTHVGVVRRKWPLESLADPDLAPRLIRLMTVRAYIRLGDVSGVFYPLGSIKTKVTVNLGNNDGWKKYKLPSHETVDQGRPGQVG